MAGADAEGPMEYCFYEECPMKDYCSKGAWKKSACWGWSDDEARTQLVRHLMMSGHHKMGKDEAESIADDTEIKHAPWEEPPPSKRARLQGPRQSAPGDDIGGPSSSSGDPRDTLMQVINALSEQRSMGMTPTPPPMPPPSSLSPGGPLGPRGLPPGTVLLRIDIAKAAVDSMARAVASARHAQRLCEAAAVGFGQEAEAIADARRAFMTLLSGRTRGCLS